MTVEQVLRFHSKLYPLMRPTDAVKLLYQNEFGGGHLIENPRRSLEWLISEHKAVAHDAKCPLIVPLGNGVVRVNLAALNAEIISLESFNEIFVESAKLIHGEIGRFKDKLSVLVGLTDENVFAFSSSELAIYLNRYATDGYPPVSHSEEFRQAYRPSYRVVAQRLFSPNGNLT